MTAGKNVTMTQIQVAYGAATAVSTAGEASSAPDCVVSLVRACRAGEQEAFRQLYQIYVVRVRGTLSRLGTTSQLDDATQEVFLRVWRALPELHDPLLLSTWIYRISVNVATDTLRASLKQKRWGTRAYGDDADNSMTAAAPDHPDHAEALHAKRVVTVALAALPQADRNLIVLVDMEDLDQKDVAEILGIPLGTVKSRLFAARKRLRILLEKEGMTV